jgi:hypothetical protein
MVRHQPWVLAIANCRLQSGLGGYRRFLAHWYLRESLTEAGIEIILEMGQGAVSGDQAASNLGQ